MHAQLVTFRLNGISERDYHESCGSLTGTFAALPGLLGKAWLRDLASGTYGGIYLWRDRASCEAYVNGPVFAAVKADARLRDVVSRDFGVFDDLTLATLPGVRLVSPQTA